MRDWKALVRERLGTRGLLGSAEEEVVAELAAHLEDCFVEERGQGWSEPEAEKRTAADIRWRGMARRIRAAKCEEGEMKNRKRTLLLPTFANLLILTLGIQALLFFGIHPRIAFAQHMWFSFPLPWLLALPLSGAAGALLAKREGASFGERLVAGWAPSLVWLGEFGVMALVFACDRRDFGAAFPLDYFGLTAVWWVVLPPLAQLVGTLPFVWERDVAVERF